MRGFISVKVLGNNFFFNFVKHPFQFLTVIFPLVLHYIVITFSKWILLSSQHVNS